MILRDSYDVPEEIARGPHSPAFREFLYNWFGDTVALTHGELNLGFLRELTPEELTVARELIRRNLKLRQNHIIEGAGLLADPEAVPILRKMLAKDDGGWALVIAGALWRINRDPVFLDVIANSKGRLSLFGFWNWKVLWLDDERAIDILVDALPLEDRESAPWRFMRRFCFRWPFRRTLGRLYSAHRNKGLENYWAWTALSNLEQGHTLTLEERNPPSYYRQRWQEPEFRAFLLDKLHKWNRTAGATVYRDGGLPTQLTE